VLAVLPRIERQKGGGVSAVYCRRSRLIFVIVLVLSLRSFGILVFAEAGDDAASVLLDTEEKVVSAYLEIVHAESTGGNVSGLLVRLNEAEDLLTQARVVYKLGDFEESARLAVLCSAVSSEVTQEATNLRLEMFRVRTVNLWLSLTLSLVSIAVVGLGCFWGWRVFKRRFYKRVLKMKPEVAVDES